MNSGNNDLAWLPVHENWGSSLAAINEASPADAWRQLVELARCNIDFIKTNQLDTKLDKFLSKCSHDTSKMKQLRLAILSSATVVHLAPSLRVAALRRGYILQLYLSCYSKYQQELLDRDSGLHRFKPDVVLISLDSRHACGFFQIEDEPEKAVSRHLANLWGLLRNAFDCQIIQQTVLPVFPSVLGGNEFRWPNSRHQRVAVINQVIRECAASVSVDVLALDQTLVRHGLDYWYDPMLWHSAKQEIHPRATPLFGELVMRLVAARRGLSSKCLILDLDNTIWGGIVGDDGVEGIVLGQGGAAGEAYLDFQKYVLELAQRGIVLAVCSKNDELIARSAFDHHPEMLLKRKDIACFVANWNDKPSNIRSIARQLNLGLDALVFVDDNPFERGVVRRELPMVSVPELPEDPALYAARISDAGYFEAVTLTGEDFMRTSIYRANAERESLLAAASDVPSYLKTLNMKLHAKAFDKIDIQRVNQLINKTNQFNLTTVRYTEQGVAALIGDNDTITIQARLTDRFGDNGIIAVIIARRSDQDKASYRIDSWLMSCRVLGRQVEEACLNLLVVNVIRKGAKFLIGLYRETSSNMIVKDLYERLGFELVSYNGSNSSDWRLELAAYRPFETSISVKWE